MIEFTGFPKIYRVSRPCIISEKIDGTNAQIYITEDFQFLTGSKERYITPADDNHGFAAWAYDNKDELMKLGVGRHFGEWWGQGIQRKYDLLEKRFSLFNTVRWGDDRDIDKYPTPRPLCCHVVPVIYKGIFTTQAVEDSVNYLRENGSLASPGFMRPEGVVCFHLQGGFGLKKTLEKDEEHKGQSKT